MVGRGISEQAFEESAIYAVFLGQRCERFLILRGSRSFSPLFVNPLISPTTCDVVSFSEYLPGIPKTSVVRRVRGRIRPRIPAGASDSFALRDSVDD